MPSTIQFPGLYPDRTQSPPALPRRFTRLRAGVREALGVGALVVAAMLPFLASPHPGAKPAACVTPVNLGGRLHVTLNCDSHLFLLLAEDPRRMLTEEYRTWQSRPLYGALGWTLAMPFRAAGLEEVGERRLPPTIWPSPGRRPATRLLPWYGGFILLNALLLAGAVMLFRRLAGARSYRDAAILLPVPVLLANEVTRAFFWTPHLQMFNVFVPVLSLWLFCWMQPRMESLRWARAAGIGAALGVGALAYGAFAVPAAGAALLLLARGAALPRRAARAAALLVAFAMPLLAWFVFVKARTGGFYSYEVERFRQFVWMADAAARGPGAFAAALAHNLGEYARVLGRVAVFPALVLAALTLAARLRGTGRPAPGEHARRVAVAVLVYLLASIPFYGLMGFYATRLAWTVVPALLALVALEAEAMRQTLGSRGWMVAAGAAVLALAHAAFWVTAPGPIS